MGFHSRHLLRDSELPVHRQVLLENAVIDLQTDAYVLGIYVGGSLAKGNPDEYSDIDLRVVVSAEEHAGYIRNKNNRPSRWGNVLFYEDISLSGIHTIAHYDCFVKMDIFYYKPTDLRPSLWLKGAKILYDQAQIVHKAVEESQPLQYRPSAGEVVLWRSKSLSYIEEIYRRVMRNEIYYALNQVNSLRWYIVNGWNMEAGRLSKSAGDWSQVEGEKTCLETWQLGALESWFCTRDKSDIMKTVASIVPEWVRLNRVLSDKVGIDAQTDAVKRVIDSVL